MNLPKAVVFDAKSYDKDFLSEAAKGIVDLKFIPIELNQTTAPLAKGFDTVCVFVHADLDRGCLEMLKELGIRHIALRCAGFNFVDLDAATELNLKVSRVPAYSPSAVAEHAVTLLLSLNRKITRANSRVRDHNFSLEGLVGFDVAGTSVGIVGCGKIGKKTAQIFRGLEAQVRVFDLYPDHAWAEKYGVEYASLETVLTESQIISLHTPLTPETHYLIREDTLKRMKPGVIIINTSRGLLVNTRDLILAVESGQVGGVCLDVYEEEEDFFFHDKSNVILGDRQLAYLLTFPNVLVTSHQAFLTREALSEIARVTITNVAAVFEGTPRLPGTVLV